METETSFVLYKHDFGNRLEQQVHSSQRKKRGGGGKSCVIKIS